jgi:hypothetical protein
MAKDIIMTKGKDMVCINPNNLDKFLKLGYVQKGFEIENKTVEKPKKEDKKEKYINKDKEVIDNGNTSR